MDEVCTQFQCPFKEELFVCYRAIDFTPKIIYMLVYGTLYIVNVHKQKAPLQKDTFGLANYLINVSLH